MRVQSADGSIKLAVILPFLSVKAVDVPAAKMPAEVVPVARGRVFERGFDGKARGGGIFGAPAATEGITHPIPPEPTTIVAIFP